MIRLTLGHIRSLIEEAVYHGSCQVPGEQLKLRDWVPFFMTYDQEAAAWYAREGCDDTSTVYECDVIVSNPASYDDLMKAVEQSGASQNDLVKIGRYMGDDNDSDYLYLKPVLQQLESMGFDSYKDEDGFIDGEWIDVMVTWHPQSVKIVSSIDVGRGE